MQVQICSRGIHLTERLRQHIQRRIDFALERFSQRIRKVGAQVRDLNGPRGGVDKSCQLTISLSSAATMVLEDRSESACAAVNHVVDKASTSIGGRIEKNVGHGKDEKISRYLFPEPPRS